MIKKIIIAMAIGLFLSVPAVMAQTGILPKESGSPTCSDAGNCGDYTLNDFLSLAVNISKWILGIVDSLALAFFIYGGLTFLLSGGSSEKVDLGKKIIIGAVIGLVIVFTSYLIIQFSLGALGVEGYQKWSSPSEFIKSLR